MNGQVKSKPTQRRYSEELKQRAVRMVFQLREETGETQVSVKRVADQLDIGVEPLRSWVKQAEIDGGWRAGTTSVDAAELKVLRQEVKELRRANAILKPASAFFAAELVLFDEPTSALDTRMTHYCDRVVTITGGHLAAGQIKPATGH